MRDWSRSTLWMLALPLLLAAVVAVSPLADSSAAPPHTGDRSAREAEVFAERGFRLIWNIDLRLPRASEITALRVLEDHVVTIESRRRFVTGLDIASGRPIWRKVVGEPGEVLFGPYRHRDRIYVNDRRNMYALDAETGRHVQTNRLPHSAESEPIQYQENAIFANRSGMVFAVDVETGDVKWQLRFHRAIRTRPVLADDRSVFIADETGVYRMIDAENGQVRWHGRLFGGVTGNPIVTETTVIVPSHDTRLYGLSIVSGDELWRLPTGQRLSGSPVLIGEVVAQPLPDEDYLLVDAGTGQELQTLRTEGRPLKRFGDYLLFDHGDHLALHGRADGQRIANVPATDAVFVSAGDDGRFVFSSRSGRLVMVRRR